MCTQGRKKSKNPTFRKTLKLSNLQIKDKVIISAKIWTKNYGVKVLLTWRIYTSPVVSLKISKNLPKISDDPTSVPAPVYCLLFCGFPASSLVEYTKSDVWSPPVVFLQEVEARSTWQLGPRAWNWRGLCWSHPWRIVEWFLLWRPHKLHLWEGNGDLYVYFSLFLVLLYLYV